MPAGIKLISVDLKTGMRSSGPGSILEAFKLGTAPPDSYAFGASHPGGASSQDTDKAVGTGTGGLY